MRRSFAEQEVTFRWDQEERVLWAGTTTPWVAAKWTRKGHAVTVLSREKNGMPCSWEVRLPWNGSRRPWTALFQQSLFSSRASARTATSSPEAPQEDVGP